MKNLVDNSSICSKVDLLIFRLEKTKVCVNIGNNIKHRIVEGFTKFYEKLSSNSKIPHPHYH